jgi:hypothetical protein
LLLGFAIVGLVLWTGCPVDIEKEPIENLPPTTFFESAPGDTSFANEVFFRWLGTDDDSDVVAYQYQLVMTDALYYFSAGQEGEVLESLVPQSEFGEELWTPRTTDEVEIFAGLEDGWYEFRVRSIDSNGKADPDPARHRFYVFFDDITPLVSVVAPPDNYDLGSQNSITFTFTASDESRSSVTPQNALAYSYRLRAVNLLGDPSMTHIADSWEPWTLFRQDPDTVTVGNAAPTFYNDLESAGGKWTFSVRVRDPAGNTGLGEVTVQHK